MRKILNNIKKYRLFYFLVVITLCLFSSLYVDRLEVEGFLSDSMIMQGSGAGTSSSALKGRLAKFDSVERITTWRGYNITILTLNNERAFCIDPTSYARSDQPYIRKEKVTNKAFLKAYNFYKQNKSNEREIYLIAQAYIWQSLGLIEEGPANAILYAMTSWLGKPVGGAEQSDLLIRAYSYYEAIEDTAPYSGNLYVYEPACGIGQAFIAEYAGEDCTDKVCTEYVCDPTPDETDDDFCQPTVELAGTCGVTSKYDDPGDLYDWKCIAGKSAYLENEALTSQSSLATKYCQVFCQEHVTTDFPNGSQTFQAGRYFEIGSTYSNGWGPIVISGTKMCKVYTDSSGKTEGINTSKFLTDYSSVVNSIPKLYTDMKNEEKKNSAVSESINGARKANEVGKGSMSGCFNQGYDYNSDMLWYTGGHCDTNYDGKNDGRYYTNGDKGATCDFGGGNYSTAIGATLGCKSGWEYSGGTCRKANNAKNTYNYYYPQKNYTSYSQNGSTSTKSVGGSCSAPSTSSSAKTAYNNAINNKTALESALNACSQALSKYNFNPTVSINISNEPYSYSSTLSSYNASKLELDNTTGANKSDTSKGISSCSGDNCTLKYYACSGNYCSTSTKTNSIKVNGANNKLIVSLSEISSYFYAKDTGYSTVLKSNGYVVGSANAANSIYIGPDIIPLSYTLSPGWVDISFNYTNIGENGRFDQYVSKIVGSEEATYVCGFNLKNDIMCKDCSDKEKVTGIDVIYRPIQLGSQAVAFPSRDGDGRTPGSNWVGTTSTGESFVSAYITNNRGVKDYEVYNLEPLYTITMTPSLIKEIREYNKSVGDYNDFNLTCKDGKQCYSEFIHSSQFSDSIGGSCGDSQSGQFDSCRTYGGGS